MIAKDKKYFLTRLIIWLIRADKGESIDILLEYYTKTLINKAKEEKYKKNKAQRGERTTSIPYKPQVSKDNQDFILEEKFYCAMRDFKKSKEYNELVYECDDFADLIEDMVESLVPGGVGVDSNNIEERIRECLKYLCNVEWNEYHKGYKAHQDYFNKDAIRQFEAKLVKELLDFADKAVENKELDKYLGRCQRCNRVLGKTTQSKKFCDNGCQTKAASRLQNDRLRGRL